MSTAATTAGLDARAVLRAYRDAPRGDRFHVRARWLSCPFPAVERAVPPTGQIVDLGCGHGLFSLLMASASAGREVTGVDVDAHKIAVAERAAQALGLDNVRFVTSPDGALPAGAWDAVTVVDVLYLLGVDRARRLLGAAVSALASGGVAVVKEMAEHPRWKHWLNTVQELTSTRVTRITQGDHVEVVPPTVIVDELERAGLAATTLRLDRHYPHPHVLIVARKG
jgi:2-polyprenyl-3-methyl-5-hydroxy-6-metoxy-1,4-benzoquinol methylase